MRSIPDSWKGRLFVIAGTIALVLGLVGIVVPVLPTTPFLLLAAICFMRGSRRLYNLLLHNRFVGAYLRNYLEGRGMPVRMKVWTLILLWAAIVSTAVLATDSLIARIILALVLVAVTIHILLVKTAKPDTKPTRDSVP
jgi:hypothetical protein